MYSALIILQYTLHDLWISRIFSIGLIIFLGCCGFGYTIGQFMVNEHIKILINFTMGAYQLCILYSIIVYVVPFITKQYHYNLFAFLIPKGINRSTIWYGINFGFIIALALSCFIFYIATIIILYSITNKLFFYLFPAFFAITAEGIFLTQLALFFSLILSQPLAYSALIACYIVCYTNNIWYTTISKTNGLFYYMGKIFYYVLPDLTLLDIKNSVMYKLHYVSINWLIAMLYLIFFSGMILCLSQIIFAKKQL